MVTGRIEPRIIPKLKIYIARVVGHKSTSSSVRKHYDNDHASAVPEDLLSCFKVLKKCRNKFDCLINEMLYIKQLRPRLNVQTEIRSAPKYSFKLLHDVNLRSYFVELTLYR